MNDENKIDGFNYILRAVAELKRGVSSRTIPIPQVDVKETITIQETSDKIEEQIISKVSLTEEPVIEQPAEVKKEEPVIDQSVEEKKEELVIEQPMEVKKEEPVIKEIKEPEPIQKESYEEKELKSSGVLKADEVNEVFKSIRKEETKTQAQIESELQIKITKSPQKPLKELNRKERRRLKKLEKKNRRKKGKDNLVEC